MPDEIRVLIADDHAVVRQGLRTFLQLQDDIEVVGEAADGAEAVRLAAELVPDVVVMDLVMPGKDGIEATREIRAVSPSTRVLVVTSFMEEDKVFAAVKAGAAGYLLKDVQPSELGDAIRTVYRGDALLHPAVAAKLMQEFATGKREPAQPDALTEREMGVLELIARGQSNREIALELGVAEKTVKTHVSNILQKLHLADRTQAALYAVRQRLFETD
ncbi:MAG: response regulator transcription factor [Dehalococcoidia bacterium]